MLKKIEVDTIYAKISSYTVKLLVIVPILSFLILCHGGDSRVSIISDLCVEHSDIYLTAI